MSLFTTFNPPFMKPASTPARAKRSQLSSSSVFAMAKHSAQPTTTLQPKIKEDDLELKDTLPLAAVSRRKLIGLAGISLAMFSYSLPMPAEARMTRAEMKNKILEKLRELREKVGILPKPKDEDEEPKSNTEKDPVPQQKSSDQQKMSVSQEDEGLETAPKPEGVDGKNSGLQAENEPIEEATPQKDKSPFLPFLNLTEVELEPLAEANFSP